MADYPIARKTIISNALEIGYDMDLVIRLCQFRTRPKTILSLLRGTVDRFTYGEIRRIYKDSTGESAPKGQLPASGARIIITSDRRLHASHIAIKLKTYETAGFNLNNAELHLRLYANYLDEFEQTLDNALLSFEHVYTIVRDLRIGDLTTIKCMDCKHHYINAVGSPISMHSCPVCNTLKSREAARVAGENAKRKEQAAAV